MKLRNYITAGTLLALLALPVGCTSEDVLDKEPTTPDTEVPGENTRQLLFNFSGLKLKSAAGTRAETIATKDETVVENLTIILAGVDSETTTTKAEAVVYEYRSNWGGVTPPDGLVDPKHQPLTLEQIGNVLVGKLVVDEAVITPEMKKRALVLVNGIKIEITAANGSKQVLNTVDDMVAAATTDAEGIYQVCGGKVNNQSMADLNYSMKLIWGPADLTTENIVCPLPMSAEVANIDFHGSTNLNIQLKRHVSRFDLRNGDTDNLRIGSIQPLDANTGIEVAATDARIDMMEQSFLPEVQKPDWSNVPNEVVPAFYTHPSALNDATPKEQPMKFKVKAKRLDPNDGTWTDRTYTLKLENEDRQPVSINANTRYVITVKAIDNLNITGFITVVDWQQGGDIDGDINQNTTASRKTPTLGDMTDDDVNSIKWTKDAAGVPTTLAFAKLYDNLSITFTTPQAVAVDPNDASVIDQPEVSVDIFAAAGEANAKVWLEAKKAVGTAPNTDTWTLDVIDAVFAEIKPDPNTVVEFPTLYVKVKNHLYPDNSFVMFKVTASDGKSISINTGTAADGSDNPLEIVGGVELGTGGSNDFEMGTTEVTGP